MNAASSATSSGCPRRPKGIEANVRFAAFSDPQSFPAPLYRRPCIHKGTNLIFHDLTTICVRRYTTLIILGIIETYAITPSFIKEAYFET